MSGPAGLTQPVQVTRDHYIFSLFPLRLKHPFCSPFSSPSSRAKARLLLSPIFLLFLFFWSVVTIDHDRCFDAAFCVCRCSVRVGERESRRWERRVGLLFLRLPLLRDLSFTDCLTYSATGTSTRLTYVRCCSASTTGLVVVVFTAGSDTAAVGKLSVLWFLSIFILTVLAHSPSLVCGVESADKKEEEHFLY